MKKIIGIIFILIGVCIAFIMKIGPAKETVWMFTYGFWPPIVFALISLIIGMSMYNRNR